MTRRALLLLAAVAVVPVASAAPAAVEPEPSPESDKGQGWPGRPPFKEGTAGEAVVLLRGHVLCRHRCCCIHCDTPGDALTETVCPRETMTEMVERRYREAAESRSVFASDDLSYYLPYEFKPPEWLPEGMDGVHVGGRAA